MEQRDETHHLTGTIDFDDAYFGGTVAGKKRGRGTEKAKVFLHYPWTAREIRSI